MARLIIATKNKGKVKEIKALLDGYDYEVLTMDEAGISLDIEENGQSFAENSVIKARKVHELSGGMVIADDSGIEIDFLGGLPGIYSARFLENADDVDRYEGVLALMEGIPDQYRAARFVCAATLITDQLTMTFIGKMEGRIAHKPMGGNGFGYDPIMYIPEFEKTVAELDDETKNRISHRGKAFEQLASKLKSWQLA